jgi:acetate kinase
MNGADAVIFSGGIGEHSPAIRARICEGLGWLGVSADTGRNLALTASEGRFDAEGSRAQLWVIPTDEELLIARDTWRVVNGKMSE